MLDNVFNENYLIAHVRQGSFENSIFDRKHKQQKTFNDQKYSTQNIRQQIFDELFSNNKSLLHNI